MVTRAAVLHITCPPPACRRHQTAYATIRELLKVLQQHAGIVEDRTNDSSSSLNMLAKGPTSKAFESVRLATSTLYANHIIIINLVFALNTTITLSLTLTIRPRTYKTV